MAPTQQQRLEQLEQDFAGLHSTLTEVMRNHQGLGERLEGRINRAKENSELMLGQLRDEQRKFQEEMRATMNALKEAMPESSTTPTREQPGRGSLGPPFGEETFHSEENQTNGRGGSWRFRKLDLPLFDGINPDGWIIRAERYFKFHRMSEEDKVEAAVVALEGDALLWFQWENGRREVQGWEELKGLLLRQFRPLTGGTLHEQWLSHVQEGGVAEYRRKIYRVTCPFDWSTGGNREGEVFEWTQGGD